MNILHIAILVSFSVNLVLSAKSLAEDTEDKARISACAGWLCATFTQISLMF